MEATVTLQVFSGRENPRWKLSSAECTELMHRLESLPESNRNMEEGGLGYSGFLLQIVPENGKPYQVRVFQGIIAFETDDPKNYRDRHGLEKWLRQQASGKGWGAVVDSL